MHGTEDYRKSGESKILAFPSSSGVGGAEGAPYLSLEQVPHDIAALSRPTVVEMPAAPAMHRQDGLAHDARNLVTAMELFSGLLSEPGVLAEEHKHFAEDLRSLTTPLSSLVERMTQAANREPGAGAGTGRGREPVFSREPLRPALATNKAVWREQEKQQKEAGAMVKSCERLLAAIAGPTVALTVSCERNIGELQLDGESLTRVLMNLVKNASEAMPSGGRVTITVRKALGVQPFAILCVQDTGKGIPAHQMGHVFQAGFSSKTARHKWPSTRHYGLGLTIVRELVEQAGGSVRVVSKLSKGTTFEIKLPCCSSSGDR